ncbi:hypothetical protein BUE80_DR000993 [Diplocarpon rosae]|nr:hypothetical protein BUE80_DR000993 [Diplocarpon rosae]
MTPSPSSLPTPRLLLTQLLNTLTTSSITPSPVSVDTPYERPSNPLKLLSPAQKALLSTMHVLFPPPMLLQALDLLDRGLVLRIREATIPEATQDAVLTAAEREQESRPTEKLSPPQANVHLHLSSPPNHDAAPTARKKHAEAKARGQNALYQVRSSQPPKSRFRDAGVPGAAGGGGGMVYTVRLEAWNCNCAAFAFASFPASSAWESGTSEGHGVAGLDEEWQFGGESLDGREGGAVPCCKHLLACVLGERWAVLGPYVRERQVRREEMAGLGGGG